MRYIQKIFRRRRDATSPAHKYNATLKTLPALRLPTIRTFLKLCPSALCLSAFCLSLTGCSLAAASVTPVEITVVTPFGEGDGNRVNYLAALEAYEGETGNTVADKSAISNEGWKSGVLEDFRNGDEPDVLFYFTGADADELIGDGKLLTISEIRKIYPDYAKNMKDSVMPVSTLDGRQYAVPVNGYWEGLFVNKKILDKCGVGYPGDDYSWDMFLADCETVKNKGYTPIACSIAEVPHYIFEYAVFNNGGVANHLETPANSGDAVGQRWAAGLGDIKDLYDRGYFPNDTTIAPDAETTKLMIENKAAFMLDGSWKVGWFMSNAANVDDFIAAYVPAKGDRKTTEIIGGLSMGYYITKKAWDDPKKREACVSFVTSMTTDEVISSFASFSLTALINGMQPPDDAGSFIKSVLEMTKNCTGFVPAVQDTLNAQARNSLFDDVKDIVAGKLTPQAAIDKCLSLE